MGLLGRLGWRNWSQGGLSSMPSRGPLTGYRCVHHGGGRQVGSTSEEF